MTPRLNLADLKLSLASGEELDVRSFKVTESIGSPFVASLIARSKNADLDLDGFAGEEGRFEIGTRRSWSGVVRELEHLRAEPDGLSTYRIEIVPRLWFLTQRRNYRIFQRLSEPEMAMLLLAEWKIPFEARIDPSAYAKREYRVQYAESDFAFFSRMLEDAGITYWFEDGEEKVVLCDATHASEPRRPLPSVDDATAVTFEDYVTAVSAARTVRPGRYTVRDVDYRLPPSHALLAGSNDGKSIEAELESFHYVPGAFLFEGTGDGTPVADDKIAARSSNHHASALARRRLEVKRAEAYGYTFRTNVLELRPGVRVGIVGHPRSDLGADKPVLVTETRLEGEATGRWEMSCRARRGDVPFRAALSTPKPRVSGVETVTVVGPPGEEIHTDEFGRVRVHFHWDRLSRMDADSSCWIPVSHAWAGAAYGGVNLPRVGQEVLVDFLGGDPDRPLVVGRVYTASQPVPFKLPENKTQSGWKSNSTNQTGGYNEIMFEDAAGKELVRIQAEKDLHRLVKHDEEDTVGHDRIREVKHDEDVTIGNNRTHRVVANERIVVGQNQSISVGINRAASIGSIDSTIVGDTHLVMVDPPGELVPGNATHQIMKDGVIKLDTGRGATITMENDRIRIEAREIEIVGRDFVKVRGEKKGVDLASPAGKNSFTGPSFSVNCGKVDISSAGLLDLKGSPIHLNGGGHNAARVTDPVGGTILRGSDSVFIGGGSGSNARLANVSDAELQKEIDYWNEKSDERLEEIEASKQRINAVDPKTGKPRYSDEERERYNRDLNNDDQMKLNRQAISEREAEQNQREQERLNGARKHDISRPAGGV